MDICTVLSGVFFILIFLLIRHLTKNHGYLESLGIPVIKPLLFLGSPPFGLHKIKWTDYYMEQVRKYGMTFGAYNGAYSVIHTIDPEIIKSIYVKNFDEFGDMTDNPHYSDDMKTIDLAQGAEWKNLRKIMSPTFTSGKLKSMMEPISDVADKAMEHLESIKNEPIEMKKFFQGFAMDTICRCAFSLETNAHEDPNHHLVKAGIDAFQGFVVNSWIESIFTMIFYFVPNIEAVSS